MGTKKQFTMDLFYSFNNTIAVQTQNRYTQIDDGSIDNTFGMIAIDLIQSKVAGRYIVEEFSSASCWGIISLCWWEEYSPD